MLPLYDRNPTKTTPFVTIALIAACVLAFAYEFSLLLGASGSAELYAQFIHAGGLVPYEITQGRDIGPPALVPLPLTAFTSMFLHGDVMHLGGNMLYLWIFGNNIEDDLGKVKFVLFYLVAGLAAAGLQVAFAPLSEIPMVGASGAIAGVLGAYLVAYPRARVRSLVFLGFFVRLMDIPAGVLLGFWLLLQILSSLAGGAGVAWWAHIGGFVFGALVFLARRAMTSARGAPSSP